ncbi:gliding motility-associated C-terminal domain-containing protein, partial [Vicingaceae bacterium]|nr:gliding motility-associated C-terminal domain-containing protein [Vicingaceae bacterium]
QTLSVSALNANQYDPACYDLGTPYKVTYLNPITTTEVEDCPAGTVVVTISGGYPEFFTGDYNITNTGAGTISSTTVSSHGGTVTISGLTDGDNYSFTILDDNNCPVTYTGRAFPNCACPADVGDVVVTGNVPLVGANEYDLTDCETITFTASNEDLNSGALTYGWAIFSCEPTLPFTAAEILDFNNNPCYLGQSTGLTTSDTDAGGISAGIVGGFDTLYVVPYTSETSLAGSLDDDADGCYDYGDVYQINYIAPTCGDCAAPTCAIGSVAEFADRTYLQCDDPCADLNDLTHVTYHTLTTDAFGNVGVVQQLSFDQVLCSGLTRSAVLRDAANACAGADILPTATNANAVGSGFNPEWIGLTPNTNYTLIVTTVIGTDCNYDFGCIDFYGIPQCVVDVGNTSAITTNNTNNDYVLCFNEEIDLATTGYSLPVGYPTASIGYALYNCLPTTNDPSTDPCFSGQYIVGDAANSVNDGTFAPALAAPNQTVWLVPITMDTTIAPIFDHDFDNDGCYEMGTPIEITYLNAIDTIVTQNCGAGEITVQISGGYPEFFLGNYNITNNGTGTLSASTLATHNGTVTLSGLTNGMNYDLSIVDDNACTITNVIGTYVSAIIDSVPFVDAGCNNNDGQLEVFASNTTGNLDYSVNGSVQTNNGLFTGLSAGSYFVQITDATGCVDSLTVVISSAQPITFNVDSIDVLCFGLTTGSITFSNVSGGDGNYLFSNDNGVITQATPIFNNLGANTYQLTVTDNSGCSLDSTITINQPDILVIDNFVIVDATCNGFTDGSVTATIIGGVTNYTYNWSNSLAGLNDNQATNVGAGTYSLAVTDQNGCSVDTLNFVVDEPAAISVNSLTVTSELCVGQCDGTIVIDSPNATLFGINGGTLAVTNQYAGLCNGNYTLQLADAAGCTFDTSAIIESPQPIVVTTNAGQTICIDQNVNLGATATGGTGTIVYTWDNGVGVGQNPSVSPILTTTYNVTATDDNGCTSNIDSQVIIVRDSLRVSVFTDTTICIGSSANIHAIASGGDGNYTYSWDNGAGLGSPVNVSPNITTVYTVSVNDGCGTPIVNDNVTISIQDIPNAMFTGGSSDCDVVNATFISNDLNNPSLYNASFLWDFGNGSIANSRDGASHTFTNTGCYDVSYTITDSIGCFSSETLFNAVCVYEVPQADFSYSPQDIDLLNPQVEFNDESIGTNLSYAWTFVDDVTPNSSIEVNPIIDFPGEEAGTFTACLTVTENNTTCSSSICKEVIIGGVLFFYIPNAFTPNEDGVNETFKPSIFGADIEDYTFMIFDRWGELLFESQNLSNGWSGYYKSKQAKQDIYVWKVRFYDSNSNTTIDKVG